MTKLEEVARAIQAALNEGSPGRDPARAAVEALRVPSVAQLDAAREWFYQRYGKPIGNDAAEGCWQAMIDAILKEKP